MSVPFSVPSVSEAKTPQPYKPLQGLSLIVVGAPGFEPGTSCSQSRRATELRHAPFSVGQSVESNTGTTHGHVVRSEISGFERQVVGQTVLVQHACLAYSLRTDNIILYVEPCRVSRTTVPVTR